MRGRRGRSHSRSRCMSCSRCSRLLFSRMCHGRRLRCLSCRCIPARRSQGRPGSGCRRSGRSGPDNLYVLYRVHKVHGRLQKMNQDQQMDCPGSVSMAAFSKHSAPPAHRLCVVSQRHITGPLGVVFQLSLLSYMLAVKDVAELEPVDVSSCSGSTP